ncbi:hypothetical protein A2767_04940 [Candidatus Roizmanbacteria bacterium RIFCSPHIGHO2_01_FULL_35_10]|uniref:Uncharacterized protein n=1 Tax=Candidatus Roizmanbacteria bacterium RIFCSPLOWO2_01_FULL_35_13 TaxID=1802055 RepID=A0A1F7I7A0_9BACT|nr:MAG: hypothetical protein A2767_04940 [Candidatus Roizmanbacteria bacterium RIFCSPHIGHO2_01_FULL_35_10]OGK39213.1 MAG: hypothetical protein A3A74_07685 [Candidatus Roizmanbacteria bacterium RIFCSPLOWO2_01_FULL_35_13]
MGREMYGTGEIRPPFDSTKAQELAEDFIRINPLQLFIMPKPPEYKVVFSSEGTRKARLYTSDFAFKDGWEVKGREYYNERSNIERTIFVGLDLIREIKPRVRVKIIYE